MCTIFSVECTLDKAPIRYEPKGAFFLETAAKLAITSLCAGTMT